MINSESFDVETIALINDMNSELAVESYNLRRLIASFCVLLSSAIFRRLKELSKIRPAGFLLTCGIIEDTIATVRIQFTKRLSNGKMSPPRITILLANLTMLCLRRVVEGNNVPPEGYLTDYEEILRKSYLKPDACKVDGDISLPADPHKLTGSITYIWFKVKTVYPDNVLMEKMIKMSHIQGLLFISRTVHRINIEILASVSILMTFRLLNLDIAALTPLILGHTIGNLVIWDIIFLHTVFVEQSITTIQGRLPTVDAIMDFLHQRITRNLPVK